MENTISQAKIFKQENSSLKLVIKIAISAGLLALIINKLNFGSLREMFINIDWPWLALALLMVNACILVSVIKWRPLLIAQALNIPFGKLLSCYYVGQFANNFLPSSIGGDAMRIYDVCKLTGKLKEAAASVIVERLLASLALALTAAFALLLVSGINGHIMIICLVGGILVLCLTVTVILLCCNFKEESKIGKWLCRLGNYKRHPVIIFKVLLLSFLFQLTLVLSNYFIFQSIGANIPLLKHFLFIPVIMAVSMIPLSINGLGIREGMYVMLYSYEGIEPAIALGCSLMFFMLVTLTSLAGGVIFVIRK
ncbi:MAG: hypothetical protein A4E53_00836 [Pelotomaculum sp. PtaB.Bin104]|nr:MAG: hypothetical protein A4E53_00836 [Pelotomaculum sp. PtaB.Bin104]